MIGHGHLGYLEPGGGGTPDGSDRHRWLAIVKHGGWALAWDAELFYQATPIGTSSGFWEDGPGRVILAPGTIPPDLRPARNFTIPLAVYDGGSDVGNVGLTWLSTVGADGSWSLVPRDGRPELPRSLGVGVMLRGLVRWPLSATAHPLAWEDFAWAGQDTPGSTGGVGTGGLWASDGCQIAYDQGVVHLRGKLRLIADSETDRAGGGGGLPLPWNDVPFEAIPADRNWRPLDPRIHRAPGDYPAVGQVWLAVLSDQGKWYQLHIGGDSSGYVYSELYANQPYDCLYQADGQPMDVVKPWPQTHHDYRGPKPLRVHPSGMTEPAWLLGDFRQSGVAGLVYERAVLDTNNVRAGTYEPPRVAQTPHEGYREGFIYAWQDEDNYSAVVDEYRAGWWRRMLWRVIGGTKTVTEMDFSDTRTARTRVQAVPANSTGGTHPACVVVNGNTSGFGGYRDTTQTSIAGDFGAFRADDSIYRVQGPLVARHATTGDEYPVPGEALVLDGVWWPVEFGEHEIPPQAVTAGTVNAGPGVSGIFRHIRTVGTSSS